MDIPTPAHVLARHRPRTKDGLLYVCYLGEQRREDASGNESYEQRWYWFPVSDANLNTSEDKIWSPPYPTADEALEAAEQVCAIFNRVAHGQSFDSDDIPY